MHLIIILNDTFSQDRPGFEWMGQLVHGTVHMLGLTMELESAVVVVPQIQQMMFGVVAGFQEKPNS